MTDQVTKWVILEAMGHRVAAGRYFIDNGLHRVDIPDVSPEAEPGSFVRSEWYGNVAIFCITPVTEEAARLMAGRCTIPEAIPWDVRRELTKLVGPGETREALSVPGRFEPPDPYDFDDEAAERDEERYNQTRTCETCGGEIAPDYSTCTCDDDEDDFDDDLPETEL